MVAYEMGRHEVNIPGNRACFDVLKKFPQRIFVAIEGHPFDVHSAVVNQSTCSRRN